MWNIFNARGIALRNGGRKGKRRSTSYKLKAGGSRKKYTSKKTEWLHLDECAGRLGFLDISRVIHLKV